MKTTSNILVALLLLGLCLSCGIKKRLYLNGYYHEGRVFKSKSKIRHDDKITLRNDKFRVKTESRLKRDAVVFHAEACVSEKKFPDRDLKLTRLEPDSCGDMIFFRDGKKMAVKVFNVGELDVSYKACDQLQGPIRKVKQSKVNKINFQDGRVRSFVPETFNTIQDNKLQSKTVGAATGPKKAKKTPWLAIILISVFALATIILALSGIYIMLIPFFVLLCAALIFS